MTRRELVALCLSFTDAYEDYPFSDGNGADGAAESRFSTDFLKAALLERSFFSEAKKTPLPCRMRISKKNA